CRSCASRQAIISPPRSSRHFPTSTPWLPDSQLQQPKCLTGGAAAGYDADQAGKSPADQRVDYDRDQCLRFKDIAAVSRCVEDSMKGRHEDLGQVVDERHEARLRGRREELEHKANGDKCVDHSSKKPDALLRTQTVCRSNGRGLSRHAVSACCLHW